MQGYHQITSFDKDFRLKIFTTDVDEFPPHWHDAVEVVRILEGQLSIGVNSEIYKLGRGDILLAEPGDVHYFLPVTKRADRIILHFDPVFFEPLAAILSKKHFSRAVLLSGGKFEAVRAFAESQLDEMLLEDAGKGEGCRLVLEARLYDLMVALVRALPMEAWRPGEIKERYARLERLNRLLEYVDSNFTEKITLSEAARAANFSVFYFSRLFRDTTGMTFGQYLINYRISKAAVTLVNGNLPITDVAFRSGFRSLKSFNRNFRAIKGCTPSQYRKGNL